MPAFIERILQRLRGLVKKLFPTAGLPIPFYRVLEKERGALRPKETGHSPGAGEPSWLIRSNELNDWGGLAARWELLRMDNLWREVQGREVHRMRSYVADLAESCGEALPRAQPALRRLRKLWGAPAPEASTPAAEAAQPVEELLKKMADLVRTPKCLCRYRTFPNAHLPRYLSKLTGAFSEEQTPAEVPELNRLILEELFPEHIQKAYELNLKAELERRRGAGLSALCLSGGGIRSATFCLGILQGLARRGLLEQFDYLSTVSGGGYIGSWLSAWLHHAGASEPAEVFKQLNRKEPNARIPVEPKPILHLRKYSNYLAPRLGIFSADTWVLIGTYLRNLALNWIVYGPFLLAACAIPRFCVSFLQTRPSPALMNTFLWTGLALAILGVAYSCAAHPGAEGFPDDEKESPKFSGDAAAGKLPEKRRGRRMKELIRLHGQGPFFVWCLAPIFISATLLTTFWFWLYTRDIGFKSMLLFSNQEGGPHLPTYFLAGILVTFLGWALARVWLFLKTKAVVRFYIPGVELGTGAAAGLLLYAAARWAFPVVKHGMSNEGIILYGCLANPLFLLIFLAAGTLFVGLGSKRNTDEDREWWARMGAWVLMLAVVWGALSTWILLGPLVFFKAAAYVASIGGLSGLITLILAHSGVTAAAGKDQEKTGSMFAKYGLALAAPLFLAAILAGLSLLAGWSIYGLATADLPRESFWRTLIGWSRFHGLDPWEPNGYVGIIAGTRRQLALNFVLSMLALGGIASLLININRFSLHAVYRNRLVRAYLAASNAKRRPNLFTGFDPADNFGLGSLREKAEPGKDQRPLHIVNMALNLVGGEELAWQQRKAETFTASKFFTGNFRLGFRCTREYASSEQHRGLTLGTAMAISGAAANPNMGYHSSPVIAFLMTLFNIRLGCWLGNPGPAGQRTFRLAAPDLPVWYAAKEALGLTDESSGFVCLSDGGHFENLGLYEMVLRRCQTIVVCDAGCDPRGWLDDLGNAIRKIRADLGVDIRIDPFNIYSRTDEAHQDPHQAEVGRYCAVGEIDYGDGSARGTLVYIKPAICGREPKDVFNYEQAHTDFPHEGTGDQFFSESQFESYRALGAWVIERVYSGEDIRSEPLDKFVARVEAYSGPAAPVSAQSVRAGLASASEVKPPREGI